MTFKELLVRFFENSFLFQDTKTQPEKWHELSVIDFLYKLIVSSFGAIFAIIPLGIAGSDVLSKSIRAIIFQDTKTPIEIQKSDLSTSALQTNELIYVLLYGIIISIIIGILVSSSMKRGFALRYFIWGFLLPIFISGILSLRLYAEDEKANQPINSLSITSTSN